MEKLFEDIKSMSYEELRNLKNNIAASVSPNKYKVIECIQAREYELDSRADAVVTVSEDIEVD